MGLIVFDVFDKLSHAQTVLYENAIRCAVCHRYL
jgi:hypothetical protein